MKKDGQRYKMASVEREIKQNKTHQLQRTGGGV